MKYLVYHIQQDPQNMTTRPHDLIMHMWSLLGQKLMQWREVFDGHLPKVERIQILIWVAFYMDLIVSKSSAGKEF